MSNDDLGNQYDDFRSEDEDCVTNTHEGLEIVGEERRQSYSESGGKETYDESEQDGSEQGYDLNYSGTEGQNALGAYDGAKLGIESDRYAAETSDESYLSGTNLADDHEDQMEEETYGHQNQEGIAYDAGSMGYGGSECMDHDDDIDRESGECAGNDDGYRESGRDAEYDGNCDGNDGEIYDDI
ncbi:hypothetical protein N431DRAFT_465603 [Stipitochalara longipes BDJ]|nr:hypothetical protein N431DRAFT_465603 [Stipitochalara longipes BDJ]